MDSLIDFFSDEILTFMIYFILLVLAAISYIPAYLSDRALSKYNKEILANPKKKVVIKPVSRPIIWKVYFGVFIIAVCLGLIKLKKEEKTKTKLGNTTTELNLTKDSLGTPKKYYQSLVDSQIKRDNFVLKSIMASLNNNGIYMDTHYQITYTDNSTAINKSNTGGVNIGTAILSHNGIGILNGDEKKADKDLKKVKKKWPY